MPDPSDFDKVAMLTRLTHPYKGKGGIVESSKYKSFSVEVRPPTWTDKKIWIGKLKTRELAQYVADAVFFYLGMQPFHFEEGVMKLPTITCMGTVIGTPVELSTQEMRASYVREIAKGEDFRPHRDDFILKVNEVVRGPDFPVLAPPQTEVVILDDEDCDREDELVFDEDAANALRMSSHSSGVPIAVVQTHVAGLDSAGGPQAVQAYVPSFDLDPNGSENILRSAGQSVSAIVFSIDDCPITSSEDEKIWIESIEELDKAAAGPPPLGSSSNDGEVYRHGYKTSPILIIPPIVRPSASTFGTPVERAVTARTALGSSSDWPSSEFAMNAKRQKIGD